jgi:tetratricopeptide (TPR) repeat protein
MGNIINGFNYDIFISYRQKDNKYDGWVTEFVNNLKRELEATFKEEVSVYFDINPHNGLLETDDVDASLREKLKCLVFIPILSRTYCDPKSFAWEHEFKAFVEEASADQFGLKVRLPNGNVASRVLPVRIHDLDPEDIKLCESVLGSVLRGVEFIYKSAGINRPLRALEEKPHDNINGTIYRDQINKVALAIKEIIQGLKAKAAGEAKEEGVHEKISEYADTGRPAFKQKFMGMFNRRVIPVIMIAAALIIAAILIYPKIFKRDILEKLSSKGERISLVILPFENMTNDTIRYGEMIQANLISFLSDYPKDLRVHEEESIKGVLEGNGVTNYASIKPSLGLLTARKLNADVYISGTVIRLSNNIRFLANMTDTKTKEIIKSFTTEGTSGDGNFMPVIDTLTKNVANYILIAKLKKKNIEFDKVTTTKSYLAYQYFIQGKDAYYNEQYSKAAGWFKKAVDADTNFVWALRFLATSLHNAGAENQAVKWGEKFQSKRDIMNDNQKLYADYDYACSHQTPNEAIAALRQLQQIDDQPPVRRSLGSKYIALQQYDNAIIELEKGLEMYKEWGIKPLGADFYGFLGEAYHWTGQYKKEKKLYKKAEKDFPESGHIARRQAILAISKKDTVNAKKYIEKWIYHLVNKPEIKIAVEVNEVSNPAIAANIGDVYGGGGLLDKAEEYYRKAVELAPEAWNWKSVLAQFLIYNDRDISEGMELAESALAKYPYAPRPLRAKGWGLYKQGKYREALDILESCWDTYYYGYNHVEFLHLQEARKAVEGMK